MTEEDFDFCLELTHLEKWGYIRADFFRLKGFEPDGCFIARDGARRLGMVTTTSYGNFAFIGMLIVPERERGRGIGEKLLRHGLDYLKRKGVETIELDGVFRAVSLYRKCGFRDKYLSLRFYRPGERKNIEIKGGDKFSAEDILLIDKSSTGLDRTRMLNKYFKDIPKHIYNNRAKNGYAIVRPRDRFYTIGPFVASGDAAFEELLDSIIADYKDIRLTMGVPEFRAGGVSILKERGFLYGQPCLRMYLGKRRDYENGIYGFFSGEKG